MHYDPAGLHQSSFDKVPRLHALEALETAGRPRRSAAGAFGHLCKPVDTAQKLAPLRTVRHR